MRLQSVALASLLLALPVVALAQGQAPASIQSAADNAAPVGEVDFGMRITGGLGDVGRFQTFRDPTSGPTLNRLTYERDRDTWMFTARFDNVGYRDQRYQASFNKFGKVKASFDWNQIPTWYSGVSQSPFTEELPGVFRLDDTIQQAVQNRTGTLQSYSSVLRSFDTRARRDIADARFTYSATENMDLRVGYTTQARSGHQPWGASFGFSNANEVPLTIDHRIHQVATELEWSTPRAMARVGYDGSWFNNGVETLVWDNPLRFTDQTNANAYSTGEGSGVGRMSIFPDSSAHTVSASGSVALPARSRAFAYVSVGSWIQDERLLPHTINTAITPIPLARETADAEARITAMNYRFTSRPLPMLWVNGQFRLYDFDNRTPHFAVGQYVRLDGTVSSSVTGGSEPFEYTRHFADIDVSVTPFRHLALRAGYGREHDDRSYRYLEETTENVVRASVDATGFAWGSARLQYDHAERHGEGFDEEVLDDIGEQLSLRQFDISDRDRDRVSAIVQVTPWDALAFNFTTSIGQDNRPDAVFGLQDNDMRAVTFGVDVAPRDSFDFGVSYAFENYSTLQRSRQANPGAQFDDPTRDWQTDMDENVHTWSFSANSRVSNRTTVDVLYDYVHGGAQYLYVLPPNSTLAVPQQLPELRNRYHRASADVRHTLTSQLALAIGYRLDKYSVDEFGRSPDILNTPLITAFVNTLYQWRPYDVHSGSVRLIYRW
jgi:MtrB/PioB family decaheme-associated outer membrane protein